MELISGVSMGLEKRRLDVDGQQPGSGQQQRVQKTTSLDWSVSACLSVFSLSSVSGPLPMTASTSSCLIGPTLGPRLAPIPRLLGPSPTHLFANFEQTQEPFFPVLWAVHRLSE